jgi:hypothetical protein
MDKVVKIYPRSLKFDRIYMATLTINKDGFKNVRVSVKIGVTTVYLDTELGITVIRTGWFPEDHLLFNADRSRAVVNIELTKIEDASLLPPVCEGPVLTHNVYSWTNNANHWDATDAGAEVPLNPMTEANRRLTDFLSAGSRDSTMAVIGGSDEDRIKSARLRKIIVKLINSLSINANLSISSLSWRDQQLLMGCGSDPASCSCEDYDDLCAMLISCCAQCPQMMFKVYTVLTAEERLFFNEATQAGLA